MPFCPQVANLTWRRGDEDQEDVLQLPAAHLPYHSGQLVHLGSGVSPVGLQLFHLWCRFGKCRFCLLLPAIPASCAPSPAPALPATHPGPLGHLSPLEHQQGQKEEYDEIAHS